MPVTAKSPEKVYDAFLFDMDGTLLNSIAVVERVWTGWAIRYGLQPEVFLKTIHGIRASDVIRGLALPGVDAEHEARLLLQEELEDVDGIVEIPGAVQFLNSLPPERWAIVTSAPAELARLRMAAAGIPMPSVIVTGEEVSSGKPSPEGYRLGAERLGVDPGRCLVFEDAVAGILAGEAAGADVVVVTTTHATPFETPHMSIADYHGCGVALNDDGRIGFARR
ncbi:HAD family hydrolase [Rhizobium sp. AN80A]|uniref:HAD family hydrolase n=1 Tax=Rhizobium sp. AN80A TaxID=3040673 RepID=UPI0032C47464